MQSRESCVAISGVTSAVEAVPFTGMIKAPCLLAAENSNCQIRRLRWELGLVSRTCVPRRGCQASMYSVQSQLTLRTVYI